MPLLGVGSPRKIKIALSQVVLRAGMKRLEAVTNNRTIEGRVLRPERIDRIISDLKSKHYPFPGSYRRSRQHALHVAKQRRWINKAKKAAFVSSAVLLGARLAETQPMDQQGGEL